MKNRFTEHILLVEVISLLFGCISPQQGDPRILLRSSVRSIVSVLHVNYGETQAGAKTVDLTIQNKTSTPRTVRISTQWFANGQAYTTLLAEPRSISMLPNEVVTVHEVAPNAKQDSFRIQLSKE